MQAIKDAILNAERFALCFTLSAWQISKRL